MTQTQLYLSKGVTKHCINTKKAGALFYLVSAFAQCQKSKTSCLCRSWFAIFLELYIQVVSLKWNINCHFFFVNFFMISNPKVQEKALIPLKSLEMVHIPLMIQKIVLAPPPHPPFPSKKGKTEYGLLSSPKKEAPPS